MVLTATVLAVGTIVEKINPEVSIYGTWWFAVLLALVAVAAVVSIVQGKMWRRPSLLLIHASVAVILMGGALTTWTGQHGSIVLHPGVRTIIIDTGDGHTAPLPFEVELTNFEVVPYPGTHTPMDFVSHLLVDGKPRDGVGRYISRAQERHGKRAIAQSRRPRGKIKGYAPCVECGKHAHVNRFSRHILNGNGRVAIQDLSLLS